MHRLPYNYPEHTTNDVAEHIPSIEILFKEENNLCVKVETNKEGKRHLRTHYCIGADWLKKDELAVCVVPKVKKVDYAKMLFSCLQHPDVCHTNELKNHLYDIKFSEPFIEIEQEQDRLTPILVVHFLQILKSLVKKGLKKSYYKVEENLNARIKGKVLVGQTLKRNIIKNRPVRTFCRYDEFGYNCIENRILKCTLIFVQKYLALFPEYLAFVSPVINYCLGAFQGVNENIDLRKLKEVTHHAFYKEYSEALRVAELILKRFGYTIKHITDNNDKVEVPPFWIKMPTLFELYVLGLLKDKYPGSIEFQFKGYGNRPDFLHIREQVIIDTKYKECYKEGEYKIKDIIDDIRQVSGYARDKKVLHKLKVADDKVVDCLIIYPDQEASDKLDGSLKNTPINGFTKFYKTGIRLPEI